MVARREEIEMAYTAKIRGSIVISDELSVISKVYCRIRDESGEGCSTFRDVLVRREGGGVIGRISYNGRIWNNLGDGRALLYDNRVEA